MFTAAELANLLEGEIVDDPATPLRSFAPAETAQPGDLTFAENENYFAKAEAGCASAVLVGKTILTSNKVLIRVANPRLAFAKVLPLFFPDPKFPAGVHPSAVIAATARVDATAHIGPHCVVGDHTVVGARAVLQGGNHIGSDCTLGDDTTLFPNVVVYARTQIGQRVRIHAGAVIGADGFGYVFNAGVHCKVPQVGHVIIGDDVELGAGTTIDRGALGATVIGRGSKIDNLVQIAHNVVIGEHCILCAQTGIAGSVTVGKHTVIGGQVGIAGHLKIGNRVTIAAQAGVMHEIPDGAKFWGTPAQPDKQTKRQLITIQQLPELIRRVAKLEKDSKEK